MKKGLNKIFHYFVLLMIVCSTPGLIATPSDLDFEYTTNDCNLTFRYDDIIAFIERVESGDFDIGFSEIEKQQTIEFISLLAIQGILPNKDSSTIENEITSLLNGKENSFEVNFLNRDFDKCNQVLANLSKVNPTSLRHCGWLSNAWEKTKKFISDHKREIIIGTIVVVSTVAVAVAAACVSKKSKSAIKSGNSPAQQQFSNSDDETALSEYEYIESDSLQIDIPSPIKQDIIKTLEKVPETIITQIVHDEKVLENFSTPENILTHHRHMSSYLLHETIDTLKERYSSIPMAYDFIKEYAPYALGPFALLLKDVDVEKHYERLASLTHDAVDYIYGSNYTSDYFEENKNTKWHLSHFSWLFDASNILKNFPKFFKRQAKVLTPGNVTNASKKNR